MIKLKSNKGTQRFGKSAVVMVMTILIQGIFRKNLRLRYLYNELSPRSPVLGS
ncbi:hypothetical protein [Gloeocapsopsis dulcis]|uniref:hypothetical protein n=1 Tax=Gloeocapsopsis dulcis TaxID=2859516 RepID=UPI00137B0371|nr:hypothetical protein [Gloeocapsopsis dulcis]